MIRGLRRHAGGFTIIEVIIFLTISVAIVGGAVALFSTRIPKAQFSQAVTELDLKIRDVSNQVASGYYPNTQNITCNGTTLTTGSNVQGTNSDCVFLGRAIQFGPSSAGCNTIGGEACDNLAIHTIWGSTKDLSGEPANSLDDSGPRFADITVLPAETYDTAFGLYITKVVNPTAGGVAFLQTFGTPTSAVASGLPSGASQVEMRTISGNLSEADDVFTRSAGGTYDDIFTVLSTPNPSTGVTLCLRSAVSEQYATIIIGDGAKPLSNTVKIMSKTEWDGSPCA